MIKRKRESYGKKALAALMFAGGLIASTQAAFSEGKVAIDDTTIQKIAETRITPEGRAYHLLRFMRSVMQDENSPVLKENFHYANEPVYFFRDSNVLANWANDLLTAEVADGEQKPGKNAKVVEHALKEAMAQLSKSSKNSIKLHLYFIASILAKRAGMQDVARECDGHVSSAVTACEAGKFIDEEQIAAAMSVLNSMAYAVIPFQIPDREPVGKTFVQSDVTTSGAMGFKKCERLKLRAVSLADRLPETSHVRRKAHRDLVIWYMHLGKTALADKQKKILFKLVGVNDDRILYPSSGICGSLSWWHLAAANNVVAVKCGRG